jgi:DNA-binding Lrp family transcriptional regulator
MADSAALDKLDKAILRALQANGRETYDVVGEQVGLSPSAVLRRVKRLEDAGIIDRYVALVRPEMVGLGLTAYINVRLEKHTEHHKRNPMVPIRSLGPSHRARIAAHLLAWTPDDRYLRFGYAATDEQIGRYVADLDFERDDIFGIFNRRSN